VSETSLPRVERGLVPTVEPRRGWKKLILALIAFVLVPAIPQVRAMVPVDETLLLFVPAMAACSLVGWWAGGRASSAVLWVALAAVLAGPRGASTNVYANLLRGWSLLLAGAFGLTCLLGGRRPFFVKALTALLVTFALALVMSLFGPVTLSHATQAVATDFTRRNEEFLTFLAKVIGDNAAQWQEWTVKIPSLGTLPADAAQSLSTMSEAGRLVFPALLSLESLAALALAWATYHRLSRRRLGAPLAPLREFRFNDQLVWGLIVGLVILLVPNLAGVRGFGLNLIVFFGALYAIRGLGVLAWFMKPGTLAAVLVVGLVMLITPFLTVLAILGFLTLGITALGLGVGDTWADWRRRARSTLS
jgi:hypothetical protein